MSKAKRGPKAKSKRKFQKPLELKPEDASRIIDSMIEWAKTPSRPIKASRWKPDPIPAGLRLHG